MKQYSENFLKWMETLSAEEIAALAYMSQHKSTDGLDSELVENLRTGMAKYY